MHLVHRSSQKRCSLIGILVSKKTTGFRLFYSQSRNYSSIVVIWSRAIYYSLISQASNSQSIFPISRSTGQRGSNFTGVNVNGRVKSNGGSILTNEKISSFYRWIFQSITLLVCRIYRINNSPSQVIQIFLIFFYYFIAENKKSFLFSILII